MKPKTIRGLTPYEYHKARRQGRLEVLALPPIPQKDRPHWLPKPQPVPVPVPVGRPRPPGRPRWSGFDAGE